MVPDGQEQPQRFLARRCTTRPVDVPRINPDGCFGQLGANARERGGMHRAGEHVRAAEAQVVAASLPCWPLLVWVDVARSARASDRASGAGAQAGQGVGLVHTSTPTEPSGSPDRGRPR